jgi:hypothetical protein
MLKRLLTATLLAALLVAGCGDSDDSGGGDGENGELVDAMAAQLTEGDDVPVSDEEAECIASDIVDGIGAERLEELGVTAESVSDDSAGDITELDFSEDEVTVLVDSIDGCADLKAIFAESMSADGTVSSEDAECLVDELPDDFVRGALEASFSGTDPTASEEFTNDLIDAMSACDVAPGGSDGGSGDTTSTT